MKADAPEARAPRRPARPLAALGLLALPAVLLLGWVLSRPVGAPAPAWPVTAPRATPCTPAGPDLIVQQDARAVEDTSVTLVTGSLLRLRTCAPGVLTFRASGTPVDGVGALLGVSVNTRPLSVFEATAPRLHRVRVPEAGWVLLGFANDAYRPPEDRNAVIENLTFTPDR